MPTLARSIFDSHRATGAAGAAVDHVLLGETCAAFALARVHDSGPDRLFAWSFGAAPSAAHPGGEELRGLLAQAQRTGARVARAVHGACEPLYLAALAAPLGLAVSAQVAEHGCGALAALAIPVGALEAAAIAGGMRLLGERESMAVVLIGSAPRGIGGIDIALDVAARLGRPLAGATLEIVGDGARDLPMAERIGFARTLTGLGARAVLFASDAATRSYLRAQGREPAWREIAAPQGGEYASRIEIDLTDAGPWIGSGDDASRSRPLRHFAGRKVARVVVGPLADPLEVAAFATTATATGIAAGVECAVVAGSACGWLALDRSRVLEGLDALGVRRVGPDDAYEFAAVDSMLGGETLTLGVPVRSASGAAFETLRAGPRVCAAALCGEIVDPRERLAQPASTPELKHEALDLDWMPAMTTAEAPAPPALDPRDPEVPLRAVVWSTVGDAWHDGRALRRGSRRGPEAASPAADLSPEIAAGWPATGFGAILAGRDFGGGPRADELAWALARSGVVAVMALGFGVAAARALAHAGVLALLRPGVHVAIGAGEEIEWPALPHALEPGRRVLLRNLTRGLSLSLAHPWDARDVSMWRAGGVLARTATVGS